MKLSTELKLNIYTDEDLREVAKVVETDELHIPYRVAMYIVKSIDGMNIKNEEELFKFVIGSIDKLDNVIKATFGITDSELECVDFTELGAVGMELFRWGLDKFKSIKGGNSKNVVATAIK